MTIRLKKSYRISAIALLLSFLLGTAALALESAEVPLALEPTELDYLALISENVYLIYEEVASYFDDALDTFDSWDFQLADIEEHLKLIYGSASVIQDYLKSMNTNTTKLIIPYLETISYSLNNSGSSVAMYLESINTKLDTLISNQGSSVGGSSVDLTGIVTKLETLISNQSAMLALLKADGAFITDISGIEDALVVLSTDLGTMISNQSDILGNLETLISNQSDILELLGEESTFYTDGYGILGNLETILGNLETLISNQSDILESLGKESTLYIDGYGILGNLETILGNLETLISNQSSALANQQAVSTTLSEIANALSYDGKTIANRITALNTNLVSGILTLYEYQESTIANQQALGGSLTTMIEDLTSVKDFLDEIVSNTSSYQQELRNVLLAMSNQFVDISWLSSIASDLNSFASNTSDHQQELRNVLLAMSNQFVDISWLSSIASDLNSFTSTTSNHQQGVNTTLANIERALIADGRTVLTRLDNINSNLIAGMRTLYTYQESIITQLQEGGGTVDISGIVDKQQELIDLVEQMNRTTVENIENITIDVTNEAYEVFYIKDNAGNETNLGELTGDVLSIGGRLLNFFFRAAFDDALDSVDAAIDSATDFYIDNAVELEGNSLWD